MLALLLSRHLVVVLLVLRFVLALIRFMKLKLILSHALLIDHVYLFIESIIDNFREIFETLS